MYKMPHDSLNLSSLDKNYVEMQVSRVKGILNSMQGKEGKPLDNDKVIALFSIAIDVYNNLCEKKEMKEEKKEEEAYLYNIEMKAVSNAEGNSEVYEGLLSSLG